MKTLTVGKYRSIQQCSTTQGLFGILAIDHQDALKHALNPANPDSVSSDELTSFKLEVVGQLIDDTSGVLLDPLYGAGQAIIQHTIKNKGLLLELEKADYAMKPLPLDVELSPGLSVNKIKKMGANGVKLFFYYNPYSLEHAERQDAIVREIVSECEHYDIPLYAEPIVYGVDEQHSKRDLVIQSAKRIAQLGVDVLKLEFPLNSERYPDESIWYEACQELNEAIDIPRVLLSAGVSFDTFARQVEIECKSGASGFIVGRAVWGDAAKIKDANERPEWLMTVGRQRLQLLQAISSAYGHSWHSYYAPQDINTDWLTRYEEMPS